MSGDGVPPGDDAFFASSTTTAAGTAPTDGNTPSTGPGRDGDDFTIIFNNTANFVDGERVFDISKEKTFSWSWGTSSMVVANEIYLMLVPEEGEGRPEVVSSNKFPSSKSRRQQNDGDPQDAFFYPALDGESANLDLELFDDGLENAVNEVLSIMISWEKDGNTVGEGRTYSPYFSVMQSGDDIKQREKEFEDNIKGLEAADEGMDYPQATLPDLPIWDGEHKRGGSARTGSETGASSVPEDDSSNGGGGGGGGLSDGAIAGIAVGSFVFLCLIGVLAWFFLRRRRNTKPRSGGYTDPTQNDASNAYIVDKIDTSAQSPHSPYSDDGQNTPLDPNTRNHYSSETAQQPYDPSYDNAGSGSSPQRPAQQYQDSSHMPSLPYDPSYDNAGSGNPPHQRSESAARSYSHLVEDGMTQDDIRRLEEEERQLDDEIERAGRRR